MTTPAITFSLPNTVPYLGGCVTEPAFFALDYLVNYRSDMRVGERQLPQVKVLETLQSVLAEPEAYGVSRADAEAARQRFLTQAGQILTAEGGQAAWLEREFT
ncbi:hypothetical protein DKM44_09505 [Deinococcus irradiatisoli]|uniref:Uncharacterized protein n=1 Tax=Deinococcus irradiatisoli TaxID=2202254 RepID=A0A2Z3JEN9_9DEIO|nr:hypothetical protein [Deinococcus irradiatisoli]AWN23435.1 hypothetical protein DKM44_09505 [Deinococcus irradiatisoli]